jgi:hypothetical protein
MRDNAWSALLLFPGGFGCRDCLALLPAIAPEGPLAILGLVSLSQPLLVVAPNSAAVHMQLWRSEHMLLWPLMRLLGLQRYGSAAQQLMSA